MLKMVNGEYVTMTSAEEAEFNTPPSMADIVAGYESIIDKHILGVVNAAGYDDSDSIAKYMARPTSPWAAECIALGDWIDACWLKAHELLNAGTPLTNEQLIAAMPVYGG